MPLRCRTTFGEIFSHLACSLPTATTRSFGGSITERRSATTRHSGTILSTSSHRRARRRTAVALLPHEDGQREHLDTLSPTPHRFALPDRPLSRACIPPGSPGRSPSWRGSCLAVLLIFRSKDRERAPTVVPPRESSRSSRALGSALVRSVPSFFKELVRYLIDVTWS